MECALLGGGVHAGNASAGARPVALTIGGVLAAIAAGAAALLGLPQPQAALDRVQIVMGRESGALYVRVGDTWHPVLNLASARLIAATPANPQPVREADLGRTKRGPVLGIPGAPQSLGRPLSADESSWTICDTDGAGATTVVVGRAEGAPVRPLAPGQAALVASAPGSPAYLLYDGQRAAVDLADVMAVRALRLEGRTPRLVSQSLLNAIPEAPPLAVPRLGGAGGATSGLPGFPVGAVLRISRGDGDEYYVVLPAGVQRIGRVAADLVRFRASRGTANALTVAPDVIGAAPIVNTLPVASFPDRAPLVADGGGGGAVCVTWEPGRPGRIDIALPAGDGPPLAAGQAPVPLAQADGRGPALDAVYLPPGRSAYVRESGGTRYLVTDTGVRFAVHDDEAARDLGLPAPNAAPGPVLAALPAGPELSRKNASVARDVVAEMP